MSQTVIKVENLSKLYHIGARQAGYRTFRETLVDAVKAPFERFRTLFSPRTSNLAPNSSLNTIWALKDVSFEVKRGEVVGIIGRNGAGKSTLLKILSRITEPTSGRVELKGRVGSLLEVGTGFHPELTGKENVYLYGAILGMDRWEVTRKFDEIIAFAELEKFVDTPVKHYSSGMYMRLAFAVAAHLEAEMLFIDEILAVGDAIFQKKCLGKMNDISNQGRTVLFVSHNMAAMEHLCSRALLIKNGKHAASGDVQKVVASYLFLNKSEAEADISKRIDRIGSGRVRATKITLKNCHGYKTDLLKMGDPFCINVEYIGKLRNACVAVIISNGWFEQLMRGYSYESVKQPVHLTSGSFSCFFETNYLASGRYSVSIWLGQQKQCDDYIQNCLHFTIEPTDVYGTGVPPNPKDGIIFTRHFWEFDDGDHKSWQNGA